MLVPAHTCMQRGRELKQADQIRGECILRLYYLHQGDGRKNRKGMMDEGVFVINVKKV